MTNEINTTNYVKLDDDMKYDIEFGNEIYKQQIKTKDVLFKQIPNYTDHVCLKCKNKTVYTYSKQFRSGDEGATVVSVCYNSQCGYVSKNNG